jgi:hypothetical protein
VEKGFETHDFGIFFVVVVVFVFEIRGDLGKIGRG